MSLSFRIHGVPATFATRREKEWKAQLLADAPQASGPGSERGLTLRFVLPTEAPNGMPLDVDNLAEPVFAILCGRLSWFGCARPQVWWWSATKEVGVNVGCEVVVSSAQSPEAPARSPDFCGIYEGKLPRNARAPELAAWARERRAGSRASVVDRVALCLEFGASQLNIADISTGVVKAVIDCLYPVYGGQPGAPEDFRVRHLVVKKGVEGLSPSQLRVTFWFEEFAQPSVTSEGARRSQPSPIPAAPSKVSQAASGLNLPRIGSGKWVVYTSAQKRRAVAEVLAQLDRIKPGMSRNIRALISDLWSEHRIRVRIVEGVLVLGDADRPA